MNDIKNVRTKYDEIEKEYCKAGRELFVTKQFYGKKECSQAEKKFYRIKQKYNLMREAIKTKIEKTNP